MRAHLYAAVFTLIVVVGGIAFTANAATDAFEYASTHNKVKLTATATDNGYQVWEIDCEDFSPQTCASYQDRPTKDGPGYYVEVHAEDAGPHTADDLSRLVAGYYATGLLLTIVVGFAVYVVSFAIVTVAAKKRPSIPARP